MESVLLVGTHCLLKLTSLLKDETEIVALLGLIGDQMADVGPGITSTIFPYIDQFATADLGLLGQWLSIDSTHNKAADHFHW